MKSIAIKFLFASLFLSLQPSLLRAQKVELSTFRNIIEPPKKRIYTEAQSNSNEVFAFFSGLFLGYKSFVSSQDQNVCSFTPSCSEFGILAVKRFGVVKGGVLTMDRLTRCNGLSPEKYQIDKQQRLLIDKPEGNLPIGVAFKE